MDSTLNEVLHDEKNKGKVETAESIHSEVNRKEFPEQVSHSPENKQVKIDGEMGGNKVSHNAPGEVNMEASIMADDVIRAGGLGARDDISSFLPVASDSTDFEAMIRDAREYEEPQGEICRHGLGWKESTETK